MGASGRNPLKIFHVNWFRTDEDGEFLWPGFGENLRVLKWIVDRTHGRGEAVETPIGHIQTPRALDLEGLDLSATTVHELLQVNRMAWQEEAEAIAEFFKTFEGRLPEELWKEHTQLLSRLRSSKVGV